ncbi:MAG: hypothetical protein MUE31_13905 [Candidatus Nanopelagicales bacterium]|nr:hypothetical protein [Candidatus Nanopelagicales bacterium]
MQVELPRCERVAVGQGGVGAVGQGVQVDQDGQPGDPERAGGGPGGGEQVGQGVGAALPGGAGVVGAAVVVEVGQGVA